MLETFEILKNKICNLPGISGHSHSKSTKTQGKDKKTKEGLSQSRQGQPNTTSSLPGGESPRHNQELTHKDQLTF